MPQAKGEGPIQPAAPEAPEIPEDSVSSPVHLNEQLGETADETDWETAGNMEDAGESADEDEEGVGDSIKPVHFGQLEAGAGQGKPDQNRLNNVWVTVIVEFGRKEMTVRELINLKEQDVIELDKLPGEPFEVRINGRLFAFGEVVVTGDAMAVRITGLVQAGAAVDVAEE